MSTSLNLPHCTAALAGSSLLLMARVTGLDGVPLVQADVASASLVVVDLEDTSAISTTALTVADVVFDALQTDARWTIDSTGFNIAVSLSGTLLPRGTTVYRAEVKLTVASGGPVIVAWNLSTSPSYS